MADDVIDTAVEPTELEVEQAPQAEQSAEAAPVQEAEQQSEQKPNRLPESVQRRINELTRQKHEGQRQIDELSRQVAHYQQLQTQGDQPQAQLPAQDPTQIAQQIVHQQNFDAACNRVYEQGKAAFSDFDSAISNLSVLGVQPEFLEAVTSMENPHAVLYALAGDLDDAARIMSLSPVLQGRELERLSLKAAAPKSIPVSKAPAPITPVDGSASVEADPEKMSTSEWMAWRNQQLASKRK